MTERGRFFYGKFFVFVSQHRFTCDWSVLGPSGGVTAFICVGIKLEFVRYTGRGGNVIVYYPRFVQIDWVSGHIVGPLIRGYSIDSWADLGDRCV